jgi:hypothetical protein
LRRPIILADTHTCDVYFANRENRRATGSFARAKIFLCFRLWESEYQNSILFEKVFIPEVLETLIEYERHWPNL